MSASEFAKKKGVSYRTVLNWIRQGRVPGAIEKNSAKGKYWEVPAAALQMERPKRAQKRGSLATKSAEIFSTEQVPSSTAFQRSGRIL